MTHNDQLQGEGDYDAARRYRKAQEEFAKSGKVDKAAHDAEEAIEGPEGVDLERARQETGGVKPD